MPVGPQDGVGRVRARWVTLLVGVVVAAAALVALPARATYGARTTADEPQYLLTALSLARDHDLWIEDEILTRAYRPFHEVTLPVQTETLGNGHAVSPHDPLLPVLLAGPVALGGWAAAKAALVVPAGVLAGLLTWIAHRRLGVALLPAAATALAFGLTAPLAPYATQVYPELPAALLVAVALAGLLAPRPRSPANLIAVAVPVALLPWLGVKYVPVAVALAAVGGWALRRDGRAREAAAAAVGLAVAAGAYLVVHRAVYGGWTVYAAGDHFAGGELTVVGSDPDYLGRSRRLVGLLLDRGFGLAAWMPGYLLAVPALAVLVRRRPAGWAGLVVPLAAGWATATWVALTMHGWWWPGRQTVVVLPCLVLVVAWWVGEAATTGRLRLLATTAVYGVVAWLWLVAEVLAGQRTLIVDFEGTTNPLYRVWRLALPDYRDPGLGSWLRHGVWLAVLAGLALASVPDLIPRTRRRPVHVPA
jgi:hypothetical protein